MEEVTKRYSRLAIPGHVAPVVGFAPTIYICARSTVTWGAALAFGQKHAPLLHLGMRIDICSP